MPRDGFGILENMAVTINDFHLLFHPILLSRTVRSFREL